MGTIYQSFDFTSVEKCHALRFEKETRYYSLRLSIDLLGDWTIAITNGRINSRLGRTRTLAFKNFAEGFEHLCQIAKIRYQKSYRCTHYQSDAPLFCLMMAVLALGEVCEIGESSTRTSLLNLPVSRIKQLKSNLLKPSSQEHFHQLGFVFNLK